jgi:transposase-like protein
MNPERKEKWKRILSMHQRGVRNSEIIRRLGVKNEHVNFVVRMYEMYGAKCYYMMHASHNPEIKREVLAECHENVLSLWDISLRHCVEPLVIRGWLKAEKSGKGSERRHKSGDMKKTTEEKPLVFKNDKEKIEYLEAENAYLKKVYALAIKNAAKSSATGKKRK